MCGISAVFKYTKVSGSDKERLFKMNQEMHYRGPDDSGVWFDEKCGMVQVRLSIIGLEKGKQPLFNEDRTLVLICNGEIYNYVEIKQKLIRKGHSFGSDSDSETILHLYEEYGVKCLEHLRGMFAFCLWDIKRNRLFSARDRIGEKFLYFAYIPCGVVFSSELKAILKYYIKEPQVNVKCLAEPVRYTSPLDKTQTFIEQILRVNPGQYVLVDDTGLRKFNYWRRDLTDTYIGTLKNAKRETLRLMRESVDIQLRSDVPIAVMLSGGIDSSTVAALAKEAGKEVHVITAGYSGSHNCDERNVARQFAKEKKLIYHEVELNGNDFKNCFEEFTEHMDEPITDIAAFPQWALYKKIKQLGFKVLLSGIGGDEIFYGYGYWNELAESLETFRDHQQLFPWKGLKKKKKFIQFVIKNWKYILFAGYPKKIDNEAVGNWIYKDYEKFIETAKLSFGNEDVNFKDINLSFSFGNSLYENEIDFIYEFLFSRTMVMAYLYLADREGMGNSVEIRAPLLDYKLVEFVSSLPLEMKYRKNNPKYFLKQIVKDIIPDYILNAPKRGFTPPISFVNNVSKKFDTKYITSEFNFYNSILADRIIQCCLKEKQGSGIVL